MKFYRNASGEVLNELSPFTGPDGTKYPEGWLKLLDAEGITALGLEPYTPPPVPEPVPQELSFAQFIIGLTEQGWINQTEANNWLTANSLPAAVEAAIATLPETAPDGSKPQLRAHARAIRPSVIQRTNELLLMLAAARGVTEEQLDDFFRNYSQV